MESGASAAQDAPSLSFRQRQILDCIIKGYHNKTIAHHLGIEVVTVKMHVGILFRKLGVSNRTEAAVRGLALYSDGPQPQKVPPQPEFRRDGGARCAISRRWHRTGSTVSAVAERRTRPPSSF